MSENRLRGKESRPKVSKGNDSKRPGIAGKDCNETKGRLQQRRRSVGSGRRLGIPWKRNTKDLKGKGNKSVWAHLREQACQSRRSLEALNPRMCMVLREQVCQYGEYLSAHNPPEPNITQGRSARSKSEVIARGHHWRGTLENALPDLCGGN